jgi:hypothetical protein
MNFGVPLVNQTSSIFRENASIVAQELSSAENVHSTQTSSLVTGLARNVLVCSSSSQFLTMMKTSLAVVLQANSFSSRVETTSAQNAQLFFPNAPHVQMQS